MLQKGCCVGIVAPSSLEYVTSLLMSDKVN